MQFPTPDNLDHIPVWQNYVWGQLSQASTGLITPRIVFIGMTESGVSVALHFLVDRPVADRYPEVNAIIEEFDDLTGNTLDIRVEIQRWDPSIDTRGVLWTYRRWLGDEAIASLELLDDRADYAAALAELQRGADTPMT